MHNAAIQKKLEDLKSIGYDRIERLGYYDDNDGFFLERKELNTETILRIDGKDKVISIDYNTQLSFPLLKQKMFQFGFPMTEQVNNLARVE